MSVLDRIRVNLQDISQFGPGFLWRHSPRLSGAKTALIRINGQPIHVRAGESDVAAVRQVFGFRHYDMANGVPEIDYRVTARYKAICDRGGVPVIVDAGANIGAAALWFKRRYPASAVVAIEPDPANYSVLRMNADLTDAVTPIEAAIGSSPGFVSVKSEGMGWATQTVRAENGLRIITMQEAFSTIKNGVPFIAKVDIEGFESDLFSDNTEWLAETTVVHIEPHDWMMPGKGTSLSFQKAIAAHSYELFLASEIITYVRLISDE
ncbi:FkbM family methyltransferase [Bradyrhizobium sp. AZCC 1610]|uniref:FkbM family methyltransferase n=1 Tax=Bradyrhizobium sp. AZCC 1610 TaxID=3117020 RepID=UPI002FF1D36C